MNTMLFKIILASCAVTAVVAAPAPKQSVSGKYHSNYYSTNDGDGKWHPDRYGDSGKYIHMPNPYIHMDNPYDGGYGPYAHLHDPYVHEESRDQYRLVKVPSDLANPYYREGYYKNNGIKIISQQHNYDEDKYDFDFETENKIRAEEKAVLKNANTLDEGIASAGFYEYIGPDGFMYRVDYTADENGFQPKLKRLETPYSGKWVVEKVN